MPLEFFKRVAHKARDFFERIFAMETIDCYSDPYAHWLPQSAQELASADGNAANRLVAAGDLVPVVIRATDVEHVASIVKQLKAKDRSVGQYRNNSSYASLLIDAANVADWLREFESKGIAYEVGAPFSSQAAIYQPSSESQTTETHADTEGLDKYQANSKAKKIIGIIDYGCAFANEKFCKELNGKRSTRVFAIWDQHQREPNSSKTKNGYQTLSWVATANYGYGVQARRKWPKDSGQLGLDSFLQQFDHASYFDDTACYQYANYPALDLREATHGTYIMDFAAGIPSPLHDSTSDWAAKDDDAVDEADIIFVQLPRNFQGEQVSGILRTYVLDAIMYILRAAEAEADVVINLSYGGLAGPHDGTSLIELAIDQLIHLRDVDRKGTTEIVMCSGNSAASNMHAFRQLSEKTKCENEAFMELSVIPDNPSLQFVEMWIDVQHSPHHWDKVNASVSIQLPDLSDPLNDKQPKIGSGLTYPLKNSQGVGIGMLCLPRPDRQGIGNGGYRVLIGLNPTYLPPSCTLAGSEALSLVGNWQVKLTNHGDHPINWSAWCERHDPVFGSGYGPRQIKFVCDTSVLCTTSNLASTNRNRVVVGGSVLDSPEYMAEYTGRGPNRGLEATQAQDTIDQDMIYAPSEENLAYWSLPGAGVLGQSKVRFPGTSVAAAVVTRALISGMTVPQLNAINKPTKSRQVFP